MESISKNQLLKEFVEFTMHHGKCDSCNKKNLLIIHIRESIDINKISKSDYRICKSCLDRLFDFANKNNLLTLNSTNKENNK